MERIRQTIQQMIRITDAELDAFLSGVFDGHYKRHARIGGEGRVPDEVYFVNQGILRVLVTDADGNEHTVHFALENQFIADYSAFLQQQPGLYTLHALEDCHLTVLPRATIEWGYAHLSEGQKMGRLIAEYYFMYQDERIKNQYVRTAKERYDAIAQVFPNIHNRVPQHMIASYLGITPIHLSRLKNSRPGKI
jgi:CRP-like cAMP-binding protein